MPRFRSTERAGEIEAVQICWRNWSEVCDLLGEPTSKTINLYTLLELSGDACGEAGPGFLALDVKTVHGEVAEAVHGDWIVAEDQPGRFRPIKPAAFHLLYVPV